MNILKSVVILDGDIYHVGEWDFQIELIDDEQIVQNPLPEGAIIDEREMTYSVEHGWQLANTAKPPTLQDRLDQMEIMLINLLEVL